MVERDLSTPVLRSHPTQFEEIWEGKRKFELRTTRTRTFEVGDFYTIREWDLENRFSGRWIRIQITNILHGSTRFAILIPEEVCIFSFIRVIRGTENVI